MTSPGQRAADEQLYGNISRSSIMLRNGHRFDIFDQDTWAWDLRTIASALGNLCRFNGHVRFYSVAEHAVRVAKWIADNYPDRLMARMAGLHHEDEESIVGDVVGPHKRYLSFPARDPLMPSDSFNRLSNELRDHAFAWFGIAPTEDDMRIVHEADAAMYAIEAAERPDPGLGLTPTDAKWLFINEHRKIQGLIDDASR